MEAQLHSSSQKEHIDTKFSYFVNEIWSTNHPLSSIDFQLVFLLS
jgi:hypothetical protein